MNNDYLQTVNEILAKAPPKEARAVVEALYLKGEENDRFMYRYGLTQDSRREDLDTLAETIVKHREMFKEMGADHPTVRAILFHQGFEDQSIFSENTIELLDRAGREYLHEITRAPPRFPD